VADLAEPIAFTCPRCGGEVSERFYGPCVACRGALGSIAGVAGAAANEPERYVPKMNVVPNQVATKD